MTTEYHAKYFAHDLTRRGSAGLDRLSMSLFDAAVNLNPHQIEAATPSHSMRLLWGLTKQQMQDWHIVFQEEDKDVYFQQIMAAASGAVK